MNDPHEAAAARIAIAILTSCRENEGTDIYPLVKDLDASEILWVISALAGYCSGLLGLLEERGIPSALVLQGLGLKNA